MKTICLLLIILSLALAQDTTYTRYYDQCRKIVDAMTIQQKIGQTIQLSFQSITNRQKQTTDPTQAVTWALGGLLIPGDAAPTADGNIATLPNEIQVDKLKDAFLKQTSDNWKKVIDRFKDLGVQVATKDKSAKYKVKFLFGTDANHGDQHVVGNIIFPHNIGLTCSHNQQNFQNVGYWTQQSMKKTGFNYAYAPNLAVSHNPQWGRFYQSLGQQDDWIYKYGQSFVKGLMDVRNGVVNGVLGGAKSFFGDGATKFGASQGSATVMNYKTYLQHNSQGFRGAIDSSLGSLEISLSGTNFIPSSYDSFLKLGYLRQNLGFTGFTTTEYDEITKTASQMLPRTFFNVTQQDGYAMIVNGGTDMIMLSGSRLSIDKILRHAKKSIEKQFILERRIDESVIRILCVKMAMGLIVKTTGSQTEVSNIPTPQISPIPESSSGNQYQDSLNAVHESLVLLKNANTLPVRNIKSTIQHIILVGESIYNLNGLTKIQLYRNYDNIGMQCGGWSVRWQGYQGNQFWTDANRNSSNASSLLDGLINLQKSSKFDLIYPNYTNFNNQVTIQTERRKFIEDLRLKKKNFNSKNTLIIGTFGQFPYAQTTGDVNIPYCKFFDNPACLYTSRRNPYAPIQQRKTLKIDFSTFEKNVVDEIKSADKNIPLISVLLSGRPMLVDTILTQSSAFVAGWLPGTSGGQGIVDAITGDYIFRLNGSNDRRNTLSFDWPSNMDTLKDFPVYSKDNTYPRIDQTTFKVGYGLSSVQSIQLVEQ